MELWLLSISMWPIPYRSVFGSWNTMAATYALINKMLLKSHTDLLRFLLLFHGLFVFVLLYLSLFQCWHGDGFTWSIGQPRVGPGCFEESLENI